MNLVTLDSFKVRFFEQVSALTLEIHILKADEKNNAEFQIIEPNSSFIIPFV